MAARRPKSAETPDARLDPAAAEPRKAGRPRSEDCCRAIRGAALDLLVDRGFADVTIESIAARAGVGKATVYRRWPSKADLVVHAFFETVAPKLRVVDSGDIRADFRRLMRLAVKQMNGPNGRALSTILGCMQVDERLGEAFRTRWLAVRRSEGLAAIERSIARGELPAETDPTFVLDALFSPLHFRLLAGHAPVTAAFSDAIVDLVFDGLQGRRASPVAAKSGASKRKGA